MRTGLRPPSASVLFPVAAALALTVTLGLCPSERAAWADGGGGALGESTQLVVALPTPPGSVGSTAGTLRVVEKGPPTKGNPGGFTVVAGPFPATFGAAGFGWGHGLHAPSGTTLPAGPVKAEGDRRSPAGIFPLLEVTGYADKAPTQKMMYRHATDALRCVDDPASPFYNSFALASPGQVRPWRSDERMLRTDGQYELTVVVGYNAAPPTAGAGSCVFLHVWAKPGEPTTGCTATSREALSQIVALLDRQKKPLLVQAPSLGALPAGALPADLLRVLDKPKRPRK